ncbi:MAG: FecR domain-containing protein, partial [Flavobacteriales bacterium]|nr:FecR domain-containing protein [Flavobacteriales bacterium]
FWSEWLAKNPEKRKTLELARKIVENMPSAQHHLSDDEILNITAGIEEGIDHADADAESSTTAAHIIPISAQATTKSMRGKETGTYKKWLAYAAAVVVLVASSYFALIQFDNPGNTTDHYVTMETPHGQKTQIKLPDGSSIWLNAGSSVKYLEHFSNTNRQIELEGEAYFEVARDTSRPFTVFAGGLSTTALGTSFNISSYPDDNLVDVNLITGKVQVEQTERPNNEPIMLTPGLGAQLNTSSNAITRTTFELDKASQWKDGIIEFEAASFEKIEKTLERWYAVDITCTNESNHQWSYNGQFDNEDLALVLRKIALTEDFEYEMDKNRIEITFNR